MFAILLIIAALLFFLLIYSFFFFLQQYETKKKEYLAELDKIKYENEKNLLFTQIEIQEQTFQTISCEIHDNIGQKLSLVKLHLNTLYQKENLKTNEKINNALQLVSDVINDLSNISRGLNPDFILDNGLIKALESEVMQLQKLEKYIINFTVKGDYIFLENQKELILFRIVQEAINNFLKHAHSNRIDIRLEFKSCGMYLAVKDYGKGFHVSGHLNNQPGCNGTGIKNIIRRTELIGGKIQLESKINEGTLIKIKLPYESKKD